MVTRPVISVILLTWNRKDDLLRAIKSVYMQSYPKIEIVVVDSNSTDGTKDVVLAAFPDIRYVRLPYNLGVIGGRNIGLANATGDIIFLLDDDAELTNPDAFQHVTSRFAAEPELAIIFFRYVLEDNSNWGWAFPFLPDMDTINSETYAHTFVGCAHCIRRTWLDRVGYLKQSFFREGEEADFGLRILAASGRILYYPTIIVRHHLNPNQRIYSDHQAYKMAHRSENELVYLAWPDALIGTLWRLSWSMQKSVREGWLSGYFVGLWRLAKALPRIQHSRQPLDCNTMRLYRTLISYQVFDYGSALTTKTSLFDYIRVRLTSKPLGYLGMPRKGIISNLDEEE